MLKYVLKRIIAMFISIFIVMTMTFFFTQLISAAPKLTAFETINEGVVLSRQMNSDSLVLQYVKYMKRMVQFDLGNSIQYENKSVTGIVAKGMSISGRIGGLTILLVVFVGVPIGIVSALHANRLIDGLILFLVSLGVTIPSFVLATLLIYGFSQKLNWLPAYGIEDWKGFVLPVFALSGYALASVSRMTRGSYLDVMAQDYMLVAKSKGLKQWRIIVHYGLRNALIPVISLMGPLISGLLMGSFVIEKIFVLPGLGRSFVQSIANQDHTVVMGIVIFYSILLMTITLIVDMIYAVLDPRIGTEVLRLTI